jgi:hypothetical protein
VSRKPDLEYRALCLLSDLQRLHRVSGWQPIVASLVADVVRSVRVLSSAEAAEALGAVALDPMGVGRLSEEAESFFAGLPPTMEVQISPRALEVLRTARLWAAYGFESAGRRLIDTTIALPDGLYRARAHAHLGEVYESMRRLGALAEGPSMAAVEVASAPPVEAAPVETPSAEAPPVEVSLAEAPPAEPSAVVAAVVIEPAVAPAEPEPPTMQEEAPSASVETADAASLPSLPVEPASEATIVAPQEPPVEAAPTKVNGKAPTKRGRRASTKAVPVDAVEGAAGDEPPQA